MNEFEIIKFLRSVGDLKIECPKCNEIFKIRDGNFFDIRESLPAAVLKIIKNNISNKDRELAKLQKQSSCLVGDIKNLNEKIKKLKTKKLKKPKQIKHITEKVNIGQIMEKILPASRNFMFNTKDCRFLANPIDYISFDGLSLNENVEKISFIEVKTGNSRLGSSQKKIVEAVENNKIKLRNY